MKGEIIGISSSWSDKLERKAEARRDEPIEITFERDISQRKSLAAAKVAELTTNERNYTHLNEVLTYFTQKFSIQFIFLDIFLAHNILIRYFPSLNQTFSFLTMANNSMDGL